MQTSSNVFLSSFPVSNGWLLRSCFYPCLAQLLHSSKLDNLDMVRECYRDGTTTVPALPGRSPNSRIVHIDRRVSASQINGDGGCGAAWPLVVPHSPVVGIGDVTGGRALLH